MSDNHLTDKKFWTDYWKNKNNVSITIPENFIFHDLFKRILQTNNVNSAVELGGFPGYYAVFLKKYYKINAALMDFFIYNPIIEELSTTNGLKNNDIEIIEGDLFQIQPEKKYDLVCSFGLIEHFKQTEEIISKHLPFLNTNGYVLITIPNFTGINGWFQKKFDKENYDKHVIECMDPNVLNKAFKNLNLNIIESGFYGDYTIWLENYSTQNVFNKLFFKLSWLVGKIFHKVFRFKNKIFSPYIYIIGQK